MTREPIAIEHLLLRPYHIWENQWLLLTVGDFQSGHFNSMTVAWGSLGVMWNRPFAQVVVRPTRHTYSLIEQYDSFTLCAFADPHRPALQYLGSHSGRDGDKIAAAGLTPIAAAVVAAPAFAEAELVVECRKIYWDDIEPAHFLDSAIERNYPRHDYHRVYFGEILQVHGTPSYRDEVLG